MGEGWWSEKAGGSVRESASGEGVVRAVGREFEPEVRGHGPRPLAEERVTEEERLGSRDEDAHGFELDSLEVPGRRPRRVRRQARVRNTVDERVEVSLALGNVGRSDRCRGDGLVDVDQFPARLGQVGVLADSPARVGPRVRAPIRRSSIQFWTASSSAPRAVSSSGSRWADEPSASFGHDSRVASLPVRP